MELFTKIVNVFQVLTLFSKSSTKDVWQGSQSTQPAFTCLKLTVETLQRECEICSMLTIKTPERRHWRRSGVFIVNFEHISHLVL